MTWYRISPCPSPTGARHPADDQRAKAISLPIPFVIRFIAKHWKIYVTIILSHSFLGIVIVGGLSWIPEFFIRTYGMARMDLGYYLGVIMVVFGPLGLLAGSQTTNWLRNRGYKDANLRAAAIGTVIMVLPASLMTLMPNQELALVLMAGMVFFTAFPVAAEIAALQMVTPNQMRAQVSAIFMLTVNIIGPGFGPVIIGASTDFIFGNEADLRYSMAIVAFCAATISAILILLGVKHFNEGLDEAASWNRT